MPFSLPFLIDFVETVFAVLASRVEEVLVREEGGGGGGDAR